VRAAAEGFERTSPAQVLEQIQRACPPSFRLAFHGPETGLYLGRFTRDERHVYYLVNNTGLSMKVTASGASNARIWDPMDGSIRTEALPAAIPIEPYASLFVLEAPAR
jgi:hypothetical protein